jgi:hypothetical protein
MQLRVDGSERFGPLGIFGLASPSVSAYVDETLNASGQLSCARNDHLSIEVQAACMIKNHSSV